MTRRDPYVSKQKAAAAPTPSAIGAGWFRVLLRGNLVTEGDGFFVTAWVAAADLGGAVDAAIAEINAHENGVTRLRVEAADPWSRDDTPEGTTMVSASLGLTGVVRFPLDDPDDRDFALPFGVTIGDTDKHASDPDELAESWRQRRQGGRTHTEVVVDGFRIAEVFATLVERLPSADTLEVRIAGHFEEVGHAERLRRPVAARAEIPAYLAAHAADLVHSGMVDVAVHLERERSTLVLTEHRTIELFSEDDALAAAFTAWLGELGVPAREPHLSIIAGFHHWHYRPPGSLDRAGLRAQLLADGFVPVTPPPAA